MNRALVIVAGGKGSRMGSELPKQFLLLVGKPVLFHTIENFAAVKNLNEMVLVLPEDQFGYWLQISKDLNVPPHINFKLCSGGATRTQSVKNGLAEVSASAQVVGIQDGVRPLLKPEIIEGIFETAELKGSAIPYVKVKDSLRKLEGNHSSIVNRSNLIAIQTPQVFNKESLKAAYISLAHLDFTDDASLYETAGFDLHFAEGSEENLKITTPEDLILAEAIIKARG